ncbi:MAG: EAL domain-containing protein [Cyanobacteria bacterium P01_F01_bin.116]
MPPQPYLILVIDDEVEIQRLVRQRFRRKIQAGELNFQFAQNGIEAWDILQDSDDIDMILTDIRMPEMDGLTLIEKLNELDTPLKAVVVSAYGDMQNIRTAMNRGAYDFITKPINFKDLDDTINKTLDAVSAMRAEQQQLQDSLSALQYMAYSDLLTGLSNRYGLMQQLNQYLTEKQTQTKEFALFMLDIERYSIIKSGFGPSVSTQLINEFARRLTQAPIPIVPARIEANIFAILWPAMPQLETLAEKVNALHQLLSAPFQLEEISISSKTRIGIALSNLPYTKPEDFLQAADTALQVARQKKGHTVTVFDMDMQTKAARRFKLEVELQEAIETQRLSLRYQPIFRLDTQAIVSFEALVRWEHPTNGIISPNDFIPLAEETGLIIPLGEWVLTEACQQIKRWQTQFGANSPAYVTINLSNFQLQSPSLLACVDKILSTSELTGQSIRFEITESVLMENSETVATLIKQLNERNIQLLIDDFGTGYSSLTCLQLLPINGLKIDRTFISDIDTNSKNFDITAIILLLAEQLGLEVVAEGLEKEEHIDILRSLSCQYGQGYLVSRPLSTMDATNLIARQSISVAD